MKTVRFDVNDAAVRDGFFRHQLLEAVAPLEETSPARWGAMTARQMVEHLAWAFELSTGRATVDCAVPEARRARYKALLHDNTPMMHEFRNPVLVAGLPPLRHPDLGDAKAALALEIDRFLDYGRSAAAALHTHPVFGPLNAEEWSRSHFKHAFHHLLQFDLVEDPGRE